jgi:hypothetical protein
MEKNYWRTVSGQHCLLAEGDIVVPIYWCTDGFTSPIGGPNKKIKKRGRQNSSACIANFQANRLLTELCKQETDLRRRKDDGHIKN